MIYRLLLLPGLELVWFARQDWKLSEEIEVTHSGIVGRFYAFVFISLRRIKNDEFFVYSILLINQRLQTLDYLY